MNGALAATLSICSVLHGCGGGLREVPRGPHPATGGPLPVVVDGAPPSPMIEMVPPRPDSGCSWADGSWTFLDNEWVWRERGWVRANDDCYLAEASLVWVPAPNQPGALFFTPAQWYQRGTGALCKEPPPCAGAQPADTTSPASALE